MAAKRSSVVRAREGVGVTMISWEPPLVTGAGDDSAVLESNTSPEKEMLKLYKPTDGTVSSQARIRTAHSNKHTPHMEHSIKYEVVRGRCRLPHMLLLLQDPHALFSSPLF